MIKIEPLTIDRLSEVRRLFEMMVVEHFAIHPYPIMDDQEVDNFVLLLYRQLQKSKYFAGWVALHDQKIVGFTVVEIQYRAVGKPNQIAAVHWLYAHPRYRERGIARRLLAAALVWTHGFGITHGEWCGSVGDHQWDVRGVQSVGTKYVLAAESVPGLFIAPKVAKLGLG